MFRIGQKVVCVDDSQTDYVGIPESKWIKDLNGLTLGAVYTIRRIGYEEIWARDVLCLWLDEIIRPVDRGSTYEPGYAATRFRPAVQRKTDISIFKKLLAPKRQRELAE
jgi:hypothetical protein